MPSGNEVKCRSASICEGRTSVVGEHEDGHVVGRLSPTIPSTRLGQAPRDARTCCGHDQAPRFSNPRRGKVVVDTLSADFVTDQRHQRSRRQSSGMSSCRAPTGQRHPSERPSDCPELGQDRRRNHRSNSKSVYSKPRHERHSFRHRHRLRLSSSRARGGPKSGSVGVWIMRDICHSAVASISMRLDYLIGWTVDTSDSVVRPPPRSLDHSSRRELHGPRASALERCALEGSPRTPQHDVPDRFGIPSRVDRRPPSRVCSLAPRPVLALLTLLSHELGPERALRLLLVMCPTPKPHPSPSPFPLAPPDRYGQIREILRASQRCPPGAEKGASPCPAPTRLAVLCRDVPLPVRLLPLG